MKKSKTDLVVSVVVIGTCLIKAILYGGSKPPSTTNEPPDTTTGDAPTNAPTMVGRALRRAPEMEGANSIPAARGLAALPLRTVATPGLTANNQQLTTHVPWHVRGAYCDWIRITFPDGFAFPHGTNLLTEVTLMSWGEVVGRGLRSAPETESANSFSGGQGHHSSDFASQSDLRSVDTPALPMRISLEPDASSVCYGRTPSNSFLFAWSNCCVNREATNRVDASIELFRDGASAITVTPLSTPTPPTYTYLPAVPPEGFVGQGQDTDWLATAFPADFAAITNKGYEAWLMEDKVGINEQNGLAKVTVTVHEMPPDGEPCYLVCGPYRVVVTHAGTYSFPLEVAVQYTARTYPTAVPLSYVADDGYRGFGGMLAAPAPGNGAPRLLGLGLPLVLPIYIPPQIYAWPASISLSQAKDTIIRIWSNLPLATACVWNSVSSTTLIDWLPPSSAQIKEVFDADDILFRKMKGGVECVCTVPIVDDRPHDCCCADCTGEGCTCGCDCWRHGGSTNGTNDPPASASEP